MRIDTDGGSRFPGWDRDWLKALLIPLTILAWLAVVVIAVWLLGHIVRTVLTLVLSGIVAFALTPLVSLFSRWMPRGVAIALAYFLGFAVLLGLLALLIVTAATQITNLVNNLSGYQAQIKQHEPQIIRFLQPFGVTKASFNQGETHLREYLTSIGTSVAKSSLDIVQGVLGTVVDIVLILILSVYLTANGPKIAAGLRRETPGSQRRHTTLLIAIVSQVVGGYIRGTLSLAALIGLLVGFGMFILHVPYAVLLGVLAFFMEFVPVIGVLISGAVCVVIALFEGVLTAVLVLGYFVIVHVIEGDVVGPRIMGRAVGIHPATALVALVAGTELFGIWGALFAAPLAGLVQAIGTAVIAELRGGDPRQVLHEVRDEAVDAVDERAREVGAHVGSAMTGPASGDGASSTVPDMGPNGAGDHGLSALVAGLRSLFHR